MRRVARLLHDLLLELLLSRLFLLLTHLRKDDLSKDGPLRNSAEVLLLAITVVLILRHVKTLAVDLVIDLVAGRFHGVGRHVASTGGVLFHVFLHLQRFDTVGEFHELNASPETRPGCVGPNLGQQVLVAGSLARQPAVIQ